MRKLIFAINTTIDGCCDHTKFNPDAEILGFFTQLTRDAGLLIFGRTTYELMVPYWPDVAKNHSGQTKADIDYAQAFDSIGKIVFTHTLDRVEDKNTRIVRTSLREEILRLKQEPGKDLLLGGVNLPSQLIRLGLIDEYLFVVHPIVSGEGRRLFDGVGPTEKLQLKLVGSTAFKSGAIALRYSKQ